MWDIGRFLVEEILLGSHSPPSGRLIGSSKRMEIIIFSCCILEILRASYICEPSQ
jgi:hypothetical protein